MYRLIGWVGNIDGKKLRSVDMTADAASQLPSLDT